MNFQIFSERLLELRKENNLRQEDFGKIVNINKQNVCNMEQGRNKTSLENAVNIAEYFNVSLDWLVGRTEKKEVNK